MRSFGSQLKKPNRPSRASSGNRLILPEPIRLRVLVSIPVACSIISYVQGLPVSRFLRSISSLNANCTAIPPKVLLLSFYSRYCPCQIPFALHRNYVAYPLTGNQIGCIMGLSNQINRVAPGGCTPKATLASDKGRYPMSSANSHSNLFSQIRQNLTRRQIIKGLAALPALVLIPALPKPAQPITRQTSLDISVQAIVLHDATTRGDSGAIQVELSKLKTMVGGVI